MKEECKLFYFMSEQPIEVPVEIGKSNDLEHYYYQFGEIEQTKEGIFACNPIFPKEESK
jgi:hypothetical protein